MSALESTLSPTAPADLTQLFIDIESRFQQTTPALHLAPDAWYLLVVTCLAAGPCPEAAGQLYRHLIQQPRYNDPPARQALVRRLREALVKAVALLGVCKPLQAACALSAAESPEDKDHTGLLEGHGDFDVVCEHVVYGFFLGDRQAIGDDLHVEVVVLAAIMSQDLGRESGWHLRGIRRLGASRADVQVIWDAIKLVASHFGQALVKVPTVEEVESSV
ncbi:hypothetical protein PG988_003714 [Apiospora saccharicola]